MKEYEIIGLGDISLRCLNKDLFHPAVDKEMLPYIDRVWGDALHKSGSKLFDGSLFNFESFTVEKDTMVVNGSFINYKYFWVQKNKNLDLNITPLGISGMLLIEINKKYVVAFAKRTSVNLQYPGYFELIPSGGIDDRGGREEINYHDILKDELHEEAGIDRTMINSISTLGLIFDLRDKVYDIACVIRSRVTKKEIEVFIQNSSEYEDVRLVNIYDIQNFLETNRGCVVPTSICILEIFNKLKTI